jgi:hypothetical protein
MQPCKSPGRLLCTLLIGLLLKPLLLSWRMLRMWK